MFHSLTLNFTLMRYSFAGIFFACLITFTVSAQKNKLTTLSGKLADKGAFTMIYLDTLSQKTSEDFAAAAVEADGKFKLTAPVEKTNIFKLRLDDQNYLMLILEPGEKVNLEVPKAKLGVEAIIKGSPQTELLYKTINALHPFDVVRDSLNKLYGTIQTSPDRDKLMPAIITEFMKNDSLQKSLLTGIIRKNPGSLAWIFLQDKFSMETDFQFIDLMDSLRFRAYPYNLFVQQFHEQVVLERKTAVGSMAPEITLPNRDGVATSLTSLRGKVVLVDFWASWCGPCRKENPNVVSAYGKYHDKGFEVFSVSLDKDRDSWLAAIQKDNLSWPNHVSDLKYWKSAGAAAYGVTAIPYTVLIGRDGRIVAKKLRGDALEQKLEELLK